MFFIFVYITNPFFTDQNIIQCVVVWYLKSETDSLAANDVATAQFMPNDHQIRDSS